MKYYPTSWEYHFSQEAYCCLFSTDSVEKTCNKAAVQAKINLSGKDTEIWFCNKTEVQPKIRLSGKDA